MRTYQIAGYRFSNNNCLLPRTILWYTRVNREGANEKLFARVRRRYHYCHHQRARAECTAKFSRSSLYHGISTARLNYSYLPRSAIQRSCQLLSELLSSKEFRERRHYSIKTTADATDTVAVKNCGSTNPTGVTVKRVLSWNSNRQQQEVCHKLSSEVSATETPAAGLSALRSSWFKDFRSLGTRSAMPRKVRRSISRMP